jgi:hypothetical protein
MNTVATLRK